jgi:transposase InsO family protein
MVHPGPPQDLGAKAGEFMSNKTFPGSFDLLKFAAALHDHWHIDMSYLNISGTFYYLCSVLDGCSRALLHWEVRPSMVEAEEVEIVLQQ